MVTVVGKVIDSGGVEEGYVTLGANGHVEERGKKGTLGLGKEGRDPVRGIVLPAPVNGHSHVGDSMWIREPPLTSLAEVVAPPRGLKHRLMASATVDEKVTAMHRALRHMAESGIALTLDFREEGGDGIALLRKAAEGTGVETFALGRPKDWGDAREVSQILEVAEGLGLSALKDVDGALASRAAAEAHRRGRFFALHVSEDVREPIDPALELKPSLLVHLAQASTSDLERVADAEVPVAFCPRSNALFGGSPPMARALKLGIPFLLGTDNVMFNAPDLFREMEFAYLSSRGHGDPLTPESLVKAAFITPWGVVGRPDMASLVPGGRAKAMVLDLPTEDPYYQVCARASKARMQTVA